MLQKIKMTAHFRELAENSGPGLLLQVIPDTRENRIKGMNDPLSEQRFSPVPGLVHRYPDRALLLTTNECFMYCRFCTRRRNWKQPSHCLEHLNKAIEHIKSHKNIKEVIISGGDPLVLNDGTIADILEKLKILPAVTRLRLSTRVLTFSPERITDKLVKILASSGKILYFMTHFNHPNEFCGIVAQKTKLLRENGIVMLNQSVLLKGINDSAETQIKLSQDLLDHGIIPYALHQLDFTTGTQHFKVPVRKGRAIIKQMRKNFTGIGIPHYVLDMKNGGGKVFL